MSELDNRREMRRQRWEERRQRWQDRSDNHQRNGHIWTGALLLIIGSIALLKSYVPDFPRWIFSWQMLLIGLGLFIGIRHKFQGAAWFVLLLIGGTFLANDYFLDGGLRRNLWPVILIVIGLFFIFRSRFKPDRICYQKKDPSNPDSPGTGYNDGQFTQNDFLDATSIFGGTKKNILSKDFKGGDIVNVFGGTELNLTQADINGTCTLEITTIFGGTKLIVPSHWSIKSEVVTIFGGIEDKRQLPATTDHPEKVLLLTGTVIFGGIDIKSF